MDGNTLNATATIGAAVLGAILGAWYVGRATKESVLIAADKAREAEQAREQQEIANVRKALLAEIITTKDRYMEGIGGTLEATPDNQPFRYIYPAQQRYFVIFEENAHLIGKIPDDRERTLIVQCYTLAKGLLDSYKFNNSMVEKERYAAALCTTKLAGQHAHLIIADLQQTMTLYTPLLKQMHAQVLTLFEELRASLEKPINMNTKERDHA